MEKSVELEQKNLINIELKQGIQVANQLKEQLKSAKRSRETSDYLVKNLLSSYEKALSMLKSNDLNLEGQSPHSFISDTSPRSEISDQPHQNVYKKRKTLQQWSEQVQVSMGTGDHGPVGDGYSWRKYGQKDILGAIFPRAYYRCMYRHQQGCLATKQVQKSDKDIALFQVTYRGRHTCKQGSQLTAGLLSPEKEEKTQKKESYEPKQEVQNQTEDKTRNFGTRLKTEERRSSVEVERMPSFSFPSTIIEFEYKRDDLFSVGLRENDIIGGNYSPSFITPEASESSYFSLSPYNMNFGNAQNLQSSESDRTEILSATNSVTNYPIGDLDILLDQVDFDPNFTLDVYDFSTSSIFVFSILPSIFFGRNVDTKSLIMHVG